MIGMAGCTECDRLLSLYSKATRELSRRGSELAEVSISYEAGLFQRLWDKCEEMRKECASLRQLITLHFEAHRKAQNAQPR